MKKPVFNYSNALYTASWILTVPILIDICTACTLFSVWLVWILFAIVVIISLIRLVHGFAQKCYKFSWGLIAQLLAGAIILAFFQLSFNHVIETPVSNSVTPDVLEIANPIQLNDSATTHTNKEAKKTEHNAPSDKLKQKKSEDTRHNK